MSASSLAPHNPLQRRLSQTKRTCIVPSCTLSVAALDSCYVVAAHAHARADTCARRRSSAAARARYLYCQKHVKENEDRAKQAQSQAQSRAQPDEGSEFKQEDEEDEVISLRWHESGATTTTTTTATTTATMTTATTTRTSTETLTPARHSILTRVPSKVFNTRQSLSKRRSVVQVQAFSAPTTESDLVASITIGDDDDDDGHGHGHGHEGQGSFSSTSLSSSASTSASTLSSSLMSYSSSPSSPSYLPQSSSSASSSSSSSLASSSASSSTNSGTRQKRFATEGNCAPPALSLSSVSSPRAPKGCIMNPAAHERMSDIEKNIYTKEEIEKHCSKESCWVVLEERVFDITSYLPDHPGGANMVLHLLTSPSVSSHEDRMKVVQKHWEHHSRFAKKKWRSMAIGKYCKEGSNCVIQ